MKEILYAAERSFLEKYLKERASATLNDFRVISDLWNDPIPEPGSDAAVDEIYSLDGDIAHIKIEGRLSPEGPDKWDRFWGYRGVSYHTIIAAIRKALNSPTVARVIFEIDSPGGTVAGCDETWLAHEALAAVKPTEVHAGSRLASAAYYLSTPAKKIYATAPTNEIGSIGVVVAAYDYSKYEEDIGIQRVVITSSNAPDKYPDIATNKGRSTIKTQLDALERIFFARVSEGRGVSTQHIAEHFGHGGMLVARDPSTEHEDAIRARMIDGLTTDIINVSTPETENSPEAITVSNSADAGKNNPAVAGTTQEGHSMDLSELLKANPAAAAEIEKLKSDAKVAGAADAAADYTARVERVMPIITSADYPSNIKALAGDVLTGKKGIDAFDAAVAVYDGQKEAGNTAAAQGHTAELGAVGADAPNLAPVAEKEIDAAIQAELDKRKVK